MVRYFVAPSPPAREPKRDAVIATRTRGARLCCVRLSGYRTEDARYSLVHAPRSSLRIASLLVWSVSAFLLYKAVAEPSAPSWALWGALAIFVLCCYSVINEFMLRPTRATTILPLERRLLVRETAAWRKKERALSIPPGARFEIAFCDRDANLYEVRIKSTDKDWVIVAEYVAKEDAERIARDANYALLGNWRA